MDPEIHHVTSVTVPGGRLTDPQFTADNDEMIPPECVIPLGSILPWVAHLS
jgi:hypothetical protein